MRTTVTLDHDAEQLLPQAMQQTGKSFKVARTRSVTVFFNRGCGDSA